jgi:hypothetical protein
LFVRTRTAIYGDSWKAVYTFPTFAVRRMPFDDAAFRVFMLKTRHPLKGGIHQSMNEGSGASVSDPKHLLCKEVTVEVRR